MTRKKREKTPDPRDCALVILQMVEKRDAWVAPVLDGYTKRDGFTGRDRDFIAQLVYGATKHRRTIDHVIRALGQRDVTELSPRLRHILRLGAYQLLFTRVPAYAAVDQSMRLAQSGKQPWVASIVNAILRRVSEHGAELVDGLPSNTPEEAAILYSYPDWLARMWWDAFGADGARALLAAGNEPAEAVIRINRLRQGARGRVEREIADAGARAFAISDIPDALVVDGFDIGGSRALADGDLFVLGRGSLRVTPMLGVEPGMRVLDACAAPGGKTAHIAQLLGGGAGLVAVDRHPNRFAGLRRMLERLGIEGAELHLGDARELPPELTGFDRILLDAPCTGLGTITSRPDLRWRRRPEDVLAMAVEQRELLAALVERLAPGGRIVYSVCSLAPDENEAITNPYAPSDVLVTWPPDGDGDGFYVAAIDR